MSDINNPSDDNGSVDDLWAEAMSEQKSATKSSADSVFRALEGGDVSGT